MSRTVIHFEGRFVSPEEALIPLTDRGYLLGEGVFATMRGYAGACFRPDAHLEILERGAVNLGLEVPPRADIVAIANEAARRTGDLDVLVRVTLARTGEQSGPARLSIVARPLVPPSEEDYHHGIVAAFVAGRRAPPQCLDPTPKLTSYAPQIMARREAEARGAAEGIQLAIDGALACGTHANIFLVEGDRLLTPAPTSGCREGITRKAILELAPSVGLAPEEKRLEPAALFEADEAFFTNTRIECLPISRVDDRPLRTDDGRFRRTDALRKALRELARSEGHRA